jgi:hypothetical protein
MSRPEFLVTHPMDHAGAVVVSELPSQATRSTPLPGLRSRGAALQAQGARLVDRLHCGLALLHRGLQACAFEIVAPTADVLEVTARPPETLRW